VPSANAANFNDVEAISYAVKAAPNAFIGFNEQNERSVSIVTNH
jgi:hypothetical protein